MMMKKIWLCFLIVLSSNACEVPVFRFALERWAADKYTLQFDEGLALATDPKRLELIDKLNSLGESKANIKILRQKSNQQFSSLSLYEPNKGMLQAKAVWEGFFNHENLNHLVESPARQKLADYLLSGASVVWVIVESGDSERDAEFEKQLRAHVAKAQKALSLSDEIILMDDQEKIDSASTKKELDNMIKSSIPLKIDFSYLRISKDDPAEEVFLSMLFAKMPPSERLNEAFAFPVFGRGRVINGVPESKLNEAGVVEMCQYLCGRCSCTVKSENPGMDLLMNISWDQYVAEGSMQVREILPPLSGVLELDDSPEKQELDSKTSNESQDLDPQVTSPVTKQEVLKPVTFKSLWITIGVFAFVLVLSTMFLLKKNK
ncbi:hypothetical protein LNTAR_08764 [Lentisphaera araneosa HTCC2155]|uniref:Uncharacterized protein n=1 Tax=Lentisphaera araneosa HTCC2155 TaxID=313628 RepID=A6DHZ4_9BACT|nr:hypothetical protein [Lentisphaera araneosa]EDM28648.1 hypothetical protein LNTAR_08764 [Lentisphaera araneosa HTCC2155]